MSLVIVLSPVKLTRLECFLLRMIHIGLARLVGLATKGLPIDASECPVPAVEQRFAQSRVLRFQSKLQKPSAFEDRFSVFLLIIGARGVLCRGIVVPSKEVPGRPSVAFCPHKDEGCPLPESLPHGERLVHGKAHDMANSFPTKTVANPVMIPQEGG